MTDIYWGDSRLERVETGGDGEMVHRDGEVFYKITNYQTMPAFFIAVVSSSDHWMFVSSTGGLTCGRKDHDNALFPYYTDDKIHDAGATTGPQTALLVAKDGKTQLWKPFSQDVNVYRVERNLYKNLSGTRLIFEELNHSLGLGYSYCWSNSEKFGFVKTSNLANLGGTEVQVNVLDGLRNLLPYGVTSQIQTELSTLMDAYKQAEACRERTAALFTLSSQLTDRAEPSEALRATVAWSMGLDNPRVLLSEDQVESFCAGLPLASEANSHGKRSAFFLQSEFTLSPGGDKRWYMVADINQGPADVAALFQSIDDGISAQTLATDIEAGSMRLLQLVGGADGCQLSSDTLISGRHFSNTLFNIMRGGTFYDGYNIPLNDFLDFVGLWNKPLRTRFENLLGSKPGPHGLESLLALAEADGDSDMERLVLEYLPLTFSRRHGDPSRPWNRFSIDIKNPDGSDKLYYQGNWRDIFQNWEALSVSYPGFAESFISKFVNASTADGYNPYRITKEGFEWEVLSADDPWSNIGYWGDHQVNYLLKLIETSCRYQPGKIEKYLGRDVFVYADVPYRLKDYRSMVNNPRDSVLYDDERADLVAGRVERTGSDGKLLCLADGSIYKVNLMEKLLVTALSKLSNFVPGGGIWMNTQRPEWNDANNALAGFGLSMVTLCYLRRFLDSLEGLMAGFGAQEFELSIEVIELFDAIEEVLENHAFMLEAGVAPKDRKAIMDELGLRGERYRESVYTGFSGNKGSLTKLRVLAFTGLVKTYLDHSIELNRRQDGLYNAYNLIRFDADGYAVEHLYEMLEGQVAVLSSGYLDPRESLDLLTALRASKIYRPDQNSYLLYPDRKLARFEEKNVIPEGVVAENQWIRNELSSGRRDFVEQDVNGKVHFNGDFRNAEELYDRLEKDDGIGQHDRDVLCGIFETVFNHRQFTGRSGAMFKYEGLGCIYWHMVSKLLLATGEVIQSLGQEGSDDELLGRLNECFDDIKDGLGLHKSPADYGAFPVDPYSHTTGFSGVQQPGMTGQVKEDVITRFNELGVDVSQGEISFSPVMLKKQEFLTEPRTWHYSVGGRMQSEDLDAGSLAFSLCGVPVVYRLADASGIEVHLDNGEVSVIETNSLGASWSQSLFKRDRQIQKLVVDIPATQLR